VLIPPTAKAVGFLSTVIMSKISHRRVHTFTRDELIGHVKDGDEVGEKITEVELEFLRSLKEGVFYGERTSRL